MEDTKLNFTSSKEDTKLIFTSSERNGSQDSDEPPTKKVKETPVEGDVKEGASDPKGVGRPEVLPKPEPLAAEALKSSLGQEDEALPKRETPVAEVLKSSSDQEDDSLPKLETLGVGADQPAFGAEDEAVPNLEKSVAEAHQSIFGPQNQAVPNLETLAQRALMAQPKPPTVILMGGDISDSGESGDEIVINVQYFS